jgi:carbonic anhydrase
MSPGDDVKREPAKRLAVLTCMDARIDPARILGLEKGDAHVLRNAGGVVTEDAIRSLAISQHLLGTDEIVLMHHTDCGMEGLSDDTLAERAGERPPWPVHGFDDLEQSVRDSVRLIEESPFVPNTSKVRGFVYDVRTGELREIT